MRINNQKLTDQNFKDIQLTLSLEIQKAGYISKVYEVSSTSMKIGLHMRSFSVDTSKHGYNARYNPYRITKKGYTRTNTPTWNQRVEFNNIINKVLNEYNVSCNIKSGPYTIRQELTAMTESDWYDQKPEWQLDNEIRGFYIESLE